MCCMRNPLIQYKVVTLMHNYLSGSNQFSPEVVRGKLKLFLIKKSKKYDLGWLYGPLTGFIGPCPRTGV